MPLPPVAIRKCAVAVHVRTCPTAAESSPGASRSELAHIKNHDTLLMTITATIAGAISMLAQFGMFFGGHRDNSGPCIIGSIASMILGPLGAMLVQTAISRTRAHAADLSRRAHRRSARPGSLPLWCKFDNAAHQVPNWRSRRARRQLASQFGT